VKAEDVLVVLRRPELNVELNRVAGELQVAERRLAALRAARTFENPTDANAQIRAQERTAEEEQLKESVRALNDEQRLLLDQVNDLTIRAPIAGTVTTWDVRQVLAGRPVARGQALLNLADVGGPWCVEVLIPERYVGDVTGARRGQTEPLEVEFVAATDPAKKYRGRVLHVAESTEIDPELGVVVEATVAVDRTAIDPVQLRPGAVVTARIRCGDSSLGSVWTRDLRRYLKSWWW
jgi:multidrug resistance efflux pump